ncbi:DUF736 domain-containing protein, partial [Brucella intermedia]|uniref:DUF736 domain-containing protein n=1 Tax=Brucella intermedia TaxID=94625 RepID=UPI001FFE9714
DNGFVGSLASKPLNLNVKSVKFLTAVMGRNRKRAGLSPSLFAGDGEFGAAWKEPACPARGNPCLSVKLGDSLFCSSVASMRAWPGRTTRSWP